MTDTPNLGLPFIAASQAQKHVTHNEALHILDAAIQLAVLDANRTAPPSSPADGQRHIVAASPTGAWSGKAKQIAIRQDGGWAFLIPKAGWRAWSVLDNALLVYDGSAWRDLRALPLDNLARLGINTSASSPNLLAVKSNAALFSAINVADAGSGDMRVQVSKESAAKTASVIFANAFSARAEYGLTGDDDFRIKVSPDGTTWFDALRIAQATGKVSFPGSGGPREMLSAARTYYVRTDGSDSNTGLANTSGAAFLTVQKAIDAVCALDLSTFQATIQIGAGTYAGQIVLRAYLGTLSPIIVGDESAPANILLSWTSTEITQGIVHNDGAGIWQVRGVKFGANAFTGLRAINGGVVKFQNVNFGGGSVFHVYVGAGSVVEVTGPYTISASADAHVAASGWFIAIGRTTTLSGTPAWGTAFVRALRGGKVEHYGGTFSGAATGARYATAQDGVIFTNSGGANYFPGNAAGSAATTWTPYV